MYQFPLCKVDEDEYFCLKCEYTTCVLELLDKKRALIIKRQKEYDRKIQEAEEEKNREELLEIRWQTYHKYHPKGMSKETYKASQRAKDAYQKEWRERKRVEKNGVS